MREVLGVNDGVLQAVNLAKILVHDVSVCHCNLDTSVAEQFLNVNDICIISEQISSE